MHVRVLAATAAAIALAAPAAHAASFMAVQATCLAGCLDQTQTYKQTFQAANFSGPVNIGALSFDRSLLGDHQTSVFHVTFWTADGREVGDFGHFMVGSLGGQVLNLKGESFAYDSSLGDLVMKIELDGYGSGGAGGGGGGFNTVLSSSGGAAAPAPSDNVDHAWDAPPMTFLPHGVVTQADPLLIVSVPEPAAWALMMLGFGGMGAVLRRRRPQTA